MSKRARSPEESSDVEKSQTNPTDGIQHGPSNQFCDSHYMGLRHSAFAVRDPKLCARVCSEVLEFANGNITEDLDATGIVWVADPSQNFKLHFVPNARDYKESSYKNTYVDDHNEVVRRTNGRMDAWTLWMDNHTCVGYHDITPIVRRLMAEDYGADLKAFYKDHLVPWEAKEGEAVNLEQAKKAIPFLGPVARDDGVHQVYVMLPFGHVIELQGLGALYDKAAEADPTLPKPRTWPEVRPDLFDHKGNFVPLGICHSDVCCRRKPESDEICGEAAD